MVLFLLLLFTPEYVCSAPIFSDELNDCPSSSIPDRTWCLFQDEVGVLEDDDLCLLPQSTFTTLDLSQLDLTTCSKATSSLQPKLCPQKTVRRLETNYKCVNGSTVYVVDTEKSIRCKVSKGNVPALKSFRPCPLVIDTTECENSLIDEAVNNDLGEDTEACLTPGGKAIKIIKNDHTYCTSPLDATAPGFKSAAESIETCDHEGEDINSVKSSFDSSYFHECPKIILNTVRKTVCKIEDGILLVWISKPPVIICQVPTNEESKYIQTTLHCPPALFQTEFFRLLRGIQQINFNKNQLPNCATYDIRKATLNNVCKYDGEYFLWKHSARGNYFLCFLLEVNRPTDRLYMVMPCRPEYFEKTSEFFSKRKKTKLYEQELKRKVEEEKAIFRRTTEIKVTAAITGPSRKQAKLESNLQGPVRTWVIRTISNVTQVKDFSARLTTNGSQERSKRLSYVASLSSRTSRLAQAVGRTSRLAQAVGRITVQFTVVVLRDEADAADFPAQVAQTLKKNVHKFDAGGEYQIDPNSIQVKQVAAKVSVQNSELLDRADTKLLLGLTGGICIIGLIIFLIVVKRAATIQHPYSYRVQRRPIRP